MKDLTVNEPLPYELRKPLEDMYNLGLQHASEAVSAGKGVSPALDIVLDAIVNAINKLKQPGNDTY